MKVLITGGAGFVGLNIISALCEKNHEVHVLVRHSSNRKYLNEFRVGLHEGDLLDYNLLTNAMVGMDAVIHCASITGGFKKDRQAVFLTNIQGTRNVVLAARENQLKRIVYTSSTATIGIDELTGRGNEETPLRDFRKKGQYSQSKLEAERIVLGAQKHGLEVIILNPAEVMGAYDYHFGWGSVIIGLVHKQIPFIPLGGGSFCDAFEVGRAHVTALTKGRSGERYILAGSDVKFEKLFQHISSIALCDLPNSKSMANNYYLLKALFWSKELFSVVTKKPPPLDLIRLRSFYRDFYFSSEKAVRELGFQYVPIEVMIEKSYMWYKKEGMIK
jgi:dihydroflavonol-4-reductase